MFSDCTGLKSWTVELPNSLTDASYMFAWTGLNSFSTPSGTLPNGLTNAYGMFRSCSGLTAWTVALPNTITQVGGQWDDSGMFSDCTSLESFTVSMPTGLTSNARYMFYGCKLNLASVKKISETIAWASGAQTFTLGIAKSLEGNTEVQGYLQDIRNKGWTVEVSYNA